MHTPLNFFTQKLAAGQALTQAESYQATQLLLSDESPADIAAYLTTLHAKGETPAEILGTIAALQAQMTPLPIQRRTIDIVGTGGDRSNSVNISTGAAILAASCGVPIVKHGNRAVSSQAGSADVLEALGVKIERDIHQSIATFNALNMTFCFAPQYHPALAQLRNIRKQIGTPTVFNLVGPFLNPARPQHYLMGVFSPRLLQPFADILLAMAIKKSAVVYSDGLDELTCSDVTQVIEIEAGQQRAYTIDPVCYGFQRCDKNALTGGNAAQNAALLTAAFNGEPGPIADTLILNAAMAVYLYGKAADLMAAINITREHLFSKKAMELLENWISDCEQK